MSFRAKDCEIPTIWCGKGAAKGSKYKGKGTPLQCLKKGFGAGKYTEIKKNLPEDSLQQIKYIGEKYEKKLKNKGIKNLKELKSFARKSSKTGIEMTLKRAFKNSANKIDYRPYNSALLYLHKEGIKTLPQCKKL